MSQFTITDFNTSEHLTTFTLSDTQRQALRKGYSLLWNSMVTTKSILFTQLQPYTRYRLLAPLTNSDSVSSDVKYADLTPFFHHMHQHEGSGNSIYRTVYSGPNSPSGQYWYDLKIDTNNDLVVSRFRHHWYPFYLSNANGMIRLEMTYSRQVLTKILAGVNYEVSNSQQWTTWKEFAETVGWSYSAGKDILGTFMLIKEDYLNSSYTGSSYKPGTDITLNDREPGVPIDIQREPSVCVVPCVKENTPITQKPDAATALDAGSYDFIQTFYVSKDSVENSPTVDLTDVTIYVKKKPQKTDNRSGINSPGIIISICDVEGGKPVPSRKYYGSTVRLPWERLNQSNDATAPAVFTFETPIRVDSGKTYGIMVDIEDPDYQVWISKRGWALLGTNNPSPGSTKEHVGELYTKSNSGLYSPSPEDGSAGTGSSNILVANDDLDLKFEVEVAEYNITDTTIRYVNDDYEFFTVADSYLGNEVDIFQPGEYIFKEVSTAGLTVEINEGSDRLNLITGSFPALTVDSTIVVYDDGTVNTNIPSEAIIVSKIKEIHSDHLILDDVSFTDIHGDFKITCAAKVITHIPTTNRVVCANSSANSTTYFTAADAIKGTQSKITTTIESVDNVDVSTFRTNLPATVPAAYKIDTQYNFAEWDTGNSRYNISQSNNEINLVAPNYIDYGSTLLSKSIEVLASNNPNLYLQNSKPSKSSHFDLGFRYTGSDNTLFYCPSIELTSSYILLNSWIINNDATDEHTNNGNAASKHISTRLTFDSGKEAEDIRAIYNAYRPVDSSVKVYAKIINDSDADPFDDKYWTELTIIDGDEIFSSNKNKNDVREYTYAFPEHAPVDFVLDGTVDVSGHSVAGTINITGTGTDFQTDLDPGDVIKIYDPLAPDDNYVIRMVTSSGSATSLDVNENIPGTSMHETGLKIAKLTTPFTAFTCKENLNIVRYFSYNGGYYDGYSSVAIKTVLLSPNNNITPYVDDYRIIGVSA